MARNTTTAAAVRTKIGQLEDRLAAVRADIKANEDRLGADYEALLTGAPALEEEERKVRVLQLEENALVAGLRAAQRDLDQAEDIEQRASLMAARGALVGSLDTVKTAAADVDVAVHGLAVAMLALQAASREVHAMGLPYKVLGPDGWRIALADRGFLENDHLQNAVQGALRRQLGASWAYERPMGRTPSAEAEVMALDALQRFDLQSKLKNFETAPLTVRDPDFESANAESARLVREYRASKQAATAPLSQP